MFPFEMLGFEWGRNWMMRMGRALYAGVAATAVLGVVVAATVGTAMGRTIESESGVIHFASLGVPLTHLCCSAALFVATVFRLTDMGRSPWWAALLCVPVLNIGLFVWIALASPAEGR